MANRLEIYREQVRNFTQTSGKPYLGFWRTIFRLKYPLAKVHSMQYNRTSCARKNHFISRSIVSAKTDIKLFANNFDFVREQFFACLIA